MYIVLTPKLTAGTTKSTSSRTKADNNGCLFWMKLIVCLIPPQPLTHSRDHACYFHAQARLAGSFMFIARSNVNHPLLTNEMISKATNLFVSLGGFQFHAAGLDVPRTFTEGVSCYERGRPGLTGVGAGPYVIIRIMFAIGNTSSISAR